VGVVAAWATPITGGNGVLGVVSGYAVAPGRLQADQLELLSLYAGHAAAAIERERLMAEVSRRNRILETLRGVLETLAGPDHVRGGLEIALLALARGLGADAVGPHVELDGELRCRSSIDLAGDGGDALARAARGVLAGPPRVTRARVVGNHCVAAPVNLPEGRAVLAAWWRDANDIGGDSPDVVEDAARSIALAIEREALDHANQETEALRRSHDHQRAFLSRLSHELRTPLTAIQGYASSLNQPDVHWDEGAQHRFLAMIVDESARLGRLVGDLLDSSAIDSGVLRLQCDWCDVGLVIEAATACVPDPDAVAIDIAADVPPIWGDHDRLEQVFVNLLENAARHGGGGAGIRVTATLHPSEGEATATSTAPQVDVRVIDRGPGIPPEMAEAVFQPEVRGSTMVAGTGLGLAIARAIVEAHGGTAVVEPAPVGATLLVTLPVEPPGTAVEVRDPAGALGA
jgi:signal transduction histidine kinase